MKCDRGVAAALREARAARFLLIPRAGARGVLIEDDAFLIVGDDVTGDDIRRVVRAQLDAEKNAAE
jgi:hypothetical protein